MLFFHNTPHSAKSNFVEPYIIECGSKLPGSSPDKGCLQADSQISVDRAGFKTKSRADVCLTSKVGYFGLATVLKISKLVLLQESKFKETGVITPEEVSILKL